MSNWYRVYRPQTFAALHVAPVREHFLSMLESGEYVHAYLLSGPKGTGKTSAARILAKVLNCEKNREVIAKKKGNLKDPCNECETCKAITRGSALCVTEMDAASNRGIDDVRALVERIGLSAADGVISVYIIDEVHMLTTEAFNALLKVLEEPPEHVVFVLATTEMHKVPATVMSRCSLIQYRKASDEEIAGALATIAKAEGVEVSQEVLVRVSRMADGSLRDGVKLFEQVAMGKKKVEEGDLEGFFGGDLGKMAEDLIQALATKNYEKTVGVLGELEIKGILGSALQKEVLESLHGRLLKGLASDSPHLRIYVAMLKKLAVPPSVGLYMPHMPFEIAALEWCLGEMETSEGGKEKGQILKTLKKSEKSEVKMPEVKMVIAEDKEKEAKREVEETKIEVEEPRVEVVTSEVEEEVGELTLQLEELIAKWHVVLRELKGKNVSLEAIVRSTKPVGIEKGRLVLEAQYIFHKEQLEIERNLLLLEEVLKTVYEAKILVKLVLADKTKKVVGSPDHNVSGNVSDTTLVKAAEEAFL